MQSITHLPVDDAIAGLGDALNKGNAILIAPPGSGKTTRVPLGLLNQAWLRDKRIVMLEPRRPAARLAASFMASMLQESVGATVGYQVRFDRRISTGTRVEVVTEGILTNRLQNDPELADVGLVIFDEFHERNLQGDLGLALCLDVQRSLRPDLKLLVMSATLDHTRLADILRAPVIHASGRPFPVEVSYLDATRSPRSRASDRHAPVLRQIQRALDELTGDILVFLPGRREISRVAAALTSRSHGCEVVTLHGSLPVKEQDLVLNPPVSLGRRIILSTDLAESSVTVPGVEVVVDSGLARKPRFDPRSGLTRLETRRIARDSAAQRAGRAGRLGPGWCYRCWTEADQLSMPEHGTSEICAADLAQLVLELANWGVSDPHDLTWIDIPPSGPWRQAVALLQDLAALDENARITSLGRKVVQIRTHPRLAAMLLRAAALGLSERAADLAALVGEPDVTVRSADKSGPVERDVMLRLEALISWRAHRSCPREYRIHALERVVKTARQLRKQVSDGKSGVNYSAGALLSIAFPDRIAQRRSAAVGRFLLSSGREVRIPDTDPLATADYLVVPLLDAGVREAWGWLAACCSLEELLEVHPSKLVSRTRISWDEDKAAVVARRERLFASLVVSVEPCVVDDPKAAHDALMAFIRSQRLHCFTWTEAARQLQARVATVHRLDADLSWPDFSDAALLRNLDDWLVPWLDDVTTLKGLQRLDIRRLLLGQLDWHQQSALDALVPAYYTTPVGRRRKIEYAENGPTIAVPLQEMFGATRTPSIAAGRLPLTLHLLSPASRPLQITSDLPHFWHNGYTEVRKEMRGRYPKHYWPDDPTKAKPCCGPKR